VVTLSLELSRKIWTGRTGSTGWLNQTKKPASLFLILFILFILSKVSFSPRQIAAQFGF
jgi:hypothetical protein